MNIPQLLFQTDTCFPALQALEKIYVPANLDVIYNPRYSYRQRAIKNDIDTIQTLFLNSPAVREPALQLIGLLCHECINITFLKREKQHQVDAQTIHLEICLVRFFEHLPTILARFNSKKLRFTLLKWLLSLCNEISERNQARSQIKLARELAPFFMKIRVIESIVKLLDHILKDLLREDADDVVQMVVDCFNYGTSFDWILLHIVTSFSFDFVPPLLDICIRETAKRTESFLQHKEPYRAELIPFISDLFIYLSTRKTPKLRAAIVDHLNDFFVGSSKTVNSVFYIANFMFIFPNIAELIKDDVQQLVTTPNLILLISLVFKPQWFVTQIHPSSLKPLNVAQNLVKILRFLPLDTLINTYDKLIPLISNPQYLNNYTKLDEKSFASAHLKLEQLMDDLFATILVKILDTTDLTLSSIPYLNDIAKNESKYDAMLKDVLEGHARAKYSSKLLSLCCMVGEKQYTSKLVSQMLYNAKSEKELKNTISFARTLKSSYPHILTDSVSYLLEHVSEYENKYLEANPSVFVNFNFIKNLANIYRWQSAEKSQVDTDIALGVNFTLLNGYLHIVFLDVLGALFERFAVAEKRDSMKIIDLVYEWIGCVERLNLFNIDRLKPDVLLNLMQKLAATSLLFVRYLPEATTDEAAVSSVCRCYFNYCQLLMCKSSMEIGSEQSLQTVQWFLLSFIKEFLQSVFDESHDLFGTKPAMLASSEQMSFADIFPSLMPNISRSAYIPDSDQCCLEQLRSKPLIQRKTAILAHSGRISNQHTRFKQKIWTPLEKLRCSIVVGFCSTLSSNYKPKLPKINDMFWCSVGSLLVSTVCPDALTSTVIWSDWSVEKECVPFYNEVTNRIRDLPLIYDLLIRLGQNGFPSMCSAIPLLKSMFAVVVNFHGVSPQKFDTSSVPQLEDIARLLSLFFSSELLPVQYKSLFELFRVTTHYETYLILTSIWEYIRMKMPQSIDELNALCNGQIPQAEFVGRANPQILTATITPIIQLHIEDLGDLLPHLLFKEDIENYENEMW